MCRRGRSFPQLAYLSAWIGWRWNLGEVHANVRSLSTSNALSQVFAALEEVEPFARSR